MAGPELDAESIAEGMRTLTAAAKERRKIEWEKEEDKLRPIRRRYELRHFAIEIYSRIAAIEYREVLADDGRQPPAVEVQVEACVAAAVALQDELDRREVREAARREAGIEDGPK